MKFTETFTLFPSSYQESRARFRQDLDGFGSIGPTLGYSVILSAATTISRWMGWLPTRCKIKRNS